MSNRLKIGLVLLLVLGLIYAEINPSLRIQITAKTPAPANAEEKLWLSFVDTATGQLQQTTADSEGLKFVNSLSEIPQAINSSLAEAGQDMLLNFGVATPDDNSLFTDNNAQAIILTPPLNSPLSLAYLQGAKPFYTDGDQVLVIFPDRTTFQGFFQTTGQASGWLKIEMSLPAVDSANAFESYTTKFNGKVVAETNDWVLMKFPSGSFLKVARPQTKVPFLTTQSTAR